MPSIIFPLEIEEMILDHLAKDDEALKTCSLVCRAFLFICRKYIFKNIVIKNDDRSPTSTTHAFERLLRETPEIADYIRKLDYTIRVADLTSPTLEESLKRISRLEFLSTVQVLDHNYDWSNNPIRPALLHLLHLPTLTHFGVNVNVFLVSDLIPCVNLKYLNICCRTVAAENTFPSTLPEHSIQLNEFVAGPGASAATMKLFTARRPDGQPIIDFGSLSKMTMAFVKPNEGRALQELFSHCRVLTNVIIRMSFWHSQNHDVKPNLADMLRPSMQTLKHIVVKIYNVVDVDVDPLFGIPSDFEDMCTENIIETVTIMVRMDARCRRRDDWGRLDEVLTTPGWFSLKRFSLIIEISNYFKSGNELEVALRKLPETQFPRLSLCNSVAFYFNVYPIVPMMIDY